MNTVLREGEADAAISIEKTFRLIAYASTRLCERDRYPEARASNHSHSIVDGGLELMSRATRFTPRTSLMMRLEMRSMTS